MFRGVVGATLVRKFGDTSASLGGEFSKENFYQATTVQGGISRTLNQGNTTVAGGFSFSSNKPILHPGPESADQKDANAYGSVTQTLSKTTVMQANYQFDRVSGYQASPFLRARVNGILRLGQTPELRNRHAFAVKVKQALAGATYAEGEYRRYTDSWSLKSNTVAFGLTHHFGESLKLGGGYRHYDQSGVFFYAPRYTGQPEFFTADFRLIPFNSESFSVRATYAPKEGLPLLRAASSVTFEYERYRTSTGFQAAIFSTGFKIPLGDARTVKQLPPVTLPGPSPTPQ